MKSRILVLTCALMFAAPLLATEVSGGGGGGDYSAWGRVTATVKSWISYWVPPSETPAVQTAKAVAPPAKTLAPAPAPAANVAPVPVAKAQPTAPAKKEASPANAELRHQPLFTGQATKSSSLKDVQAVRDQIKDKPVLKVSQAGHAGKSKMEKSKTGVPVINWAQLKKIKKVPRLDIGTENLISAEDFKMTSLNWGAQRPSEFKRLPQPVAVSDRELQNLLATPVTKVLGARGLQANIRTVGQPVTKEVVDLIVYDIQEATKVTLQPYKPLSEEQLKMVAALILFDRGNHCHMIMGLFHQLASAEKTKVEANYHLGACAAQLKMHQSAFEILSKVVQSEDAEFAPDALALLSKDLLVIYEKDFYKLVKGLKNPKALMTDKTRDETVYRLAKGAYRAGDFKTSIGYAGQVSTSAEYSDDARFLVGMNSFALGDKAGALKKLQELWASLEARKAGDSNIRALTSVNLARMYFAQKKFDKALEHYMQVPKDHPLWVQALIEQGWTQLAIEDYSGAIGNMYSLHSPYFKAVYQPESFVVRTIGYLSICQYGDAYKSLSFLEKDYRDWYGKTSSYLTSKNKPEDIYATVKNYIRGKSTDDVEGVPYQVWREMAHRKDFLNLQTALNDKQDEGKRYEGVNEKIKEEKASIRWHAEQSKKRFDQWRNQIAKASNDKGASKNLSSMQASQKLEKDLTIAYRFQLSILEQSREGYLDFQKKSQTNLDGETVTLSRKAGELLLGHATHMQKEMSRLLDNNEFLRYEVFSGSGENIRYQVAGGQVSGANRIPAHIKPTKMMNWNFDGEFWEDEIGSYRSSLQNNCPVNQMAQKAMPVDKQADKQARHTDDDDDN